jgi:cell division protease FtsH
MHGFSSKEGVIVLAATNRPDVLDQALLRPGRFDPSVVVQALDKIARQAILKVYTRGEPLAGHVLANWPIQLRAPSARIRAWARDERR